MWGQAVEREPPAGVCRDAELSKCWCDETLDCVGRTVGWNTKMKWKVLVLHGKFLNVILKKKKKKVNIQAHHQRNSWRYNITTYTVGSIWFTCIALVCRQSLIAPEVLAMQQALKGFKIDRRVILGQCVRGDVSVSGSTHLEAHPLITKHSRAEL